MFFMIMQTGLCLPLLCSNKVIKQAVGLCAGQDMVRFYTGGKESTGSALLVCWGRGTGPGSVW